MTQKQRQAQRRNNAFGPLQDDSSSSSDEEDVFMGVCVSYSAVCQDDDCSDQHCECARSLNSEEHGDMDDSECGMECTINIE